MTGIKSIDWIKSRLASRKDTRSKVQWQGLTGRMNAILGKRPKDNLMETPVEISPDPQSRQSNISAAGATAEPSAVRQQGELNGQPTVTQVHTQASGKKPVVAQPRKQASKKKPAVTQTHTQTSEKNAAVMQGHTQTSEKHTAVAQAQTQTSKNKPAVAQTHTQKSKKKQAAAQTHMQKQKKKSAVAHRQAPAKKPAMAQALTQTPKGKQAQPKARSQSPAGRSAQPKINMQSFENPEAAGSANEPDLQAPSTLMIAQEQDLQASLLAQEPVQPATLPIPEQSTQAPSSSLHGDEQSHTDPAQPVLLQPQEDEPQKPRRLDVRSFFRSYRMHALKGFGAVGLLASLTLGGHQYVQANMHEVFHVLYNGQEVGTVSSPQVVDDFKIAQYKLLKNRYPDLNIALNTDAVLLKSENAYKEKPDDQATLTKLGGMLNAQIIGVQLLVDGKAQGILKDQQTAEQVLNDIKAKYAPQAAKSDAKVAALSAPAEPAPGESTLQEVDFAQKVELKPVTIKPEDINDPKLLETTLQTGGVKENIYTVAKGDCLGCIAKKFNITKQAIFQNNPGITEDLKEGQKLNLTVAAPVISVKTVETLVENQEIQYVTETINDPAKRVGVSETVQAGKNGMKKVSFKVTKVDGLMADEELIKEEIVQEPVKAIVKTGSKVVVGEGTGKFAWPVVSATMTSGFGYRWGKLHKGLDLVSGNKNILAADNGKVVYAGYRNDYGNCVIIDHLNGYRTLYGHMSQINVTNGQIVEKGEKVGYMGSTGDSTGVHLHFEIQRNETPENPLKYLNF